MFLVLVHLDTHVSRSEEKYCLYVCMFVYIHTLRGSIQSFLFTKSTLLKYSWKKVLNDRGCINLPFDDPGCSFEK